MTNKNGDKGKRFELHVERFLSEALGGLAKRPRQVGFHDVGDIHLHPFILQCKNWNDIASAMLAGVEGATKQAANAGYPYGAAVIKRRNANVAQARVVMTLATFRQLVVRLLRAEGLLKDHAPEAHRQHMSKLEKE